MMHSTFRSVAFYIWDVRPSYSNGVRRGGSSILVWEGHWQEVRSTEVPQRGPGAKPRWGSEREAPRSPKVTS